MIFRSGFKITQGFGMDNTDPAFLDHYHNFGLLGHEGLDVVYGQWEKLPVVLWGIKEGLNGKVVRVNNDPAGAYGRFVTVWVQELNCAFMYCHLASVCVTIGEEVETGDAIGIMGGSAFGRDYVFGKDDGVSPHVHISKIPTDENGFRDYSLLRNGYGGLVDPTPHFI